LSYCFLVTLKSWRICFLKQGMQFSKEPRICRTLHLLWWWACREAWGANLELTEKSLWSGGCLDDHILMLDHNDKYFTHAYLAMNCLLFVQKESFQSLREVPWVENFNNTWCICVFYVFFLTRIHVQQVIVQNLRAQLHAKSR
jgi:hypothetical protein